MANPKFHVTTDSCADMRKSEYEQKGLRLMVLKRILNGEEIAEVYDTDAEFDAFYESIKNGDRPTTAALNQDEFTAFFEKVLEETKTGDIIHICLSSGLSLTYDNGKKAVDELNKKLTDRKIYLLDSRSATLIMAGLCERALELQSEGIAAADAMKTLEEFRDHQHGWFFVSDLFHLKRGGRISGAKAAIGTLLGIHPVMTVNKEGKLVLHGKARGGKKAIQYVLEQMIELGEKANPDFANGTFYVARTNVTETYKELLAAVKAKYPNATVKTGIIGPIIGTHTGCGACGVLWTGAPRLEIQ